MTSRTGITGAPRPAADRNAGAEEIPVPGGQIEGDPTPPPSAGAQAEVRATPRRKRPIIRNLTLPPLALIAAVNVLGFSYYRLPAVERLGHPLDPLLKPSGYVGQSAGIATFLLFAFLWLYPLRKKFRFLSFTGPIPIWLEVHIAAGLLVPVLGATHAAWRFNGLVGLGYAAMLLVCFSGIAGRYLYMRIPRTREGVEMTIDQIGQRRAELLEHLSAATGVNPSDLKEILAVDPAGYRDLGVIGTFRKLIADDLQKRRAMRRLKREFRSRGVEEARGSRRALRSALKLARRQMALAQQVRILESTHRIFRYWHAAHKPVAITAFVAVILHVAVVILFGATWFW